MFKKIFLSLAISVFALAPIANTANAATGVDQLKKNLGAFGDNTGLGSDTDLKTKIASIVNVLLGFLGLIAVIIIIYAGFKWLTAAGNDEQVTQAKSTLRNAVIGITVVALSYIIVNFVVNAVNDSAGNGGGGNGAGGGGQVQITYCRFSDA